MSTPPAATPLTPIPDRTAGQSRLLKTLAGLLVAALVLGVGGFAYLRYVGQPETIYVSGKSVGTVANRATADRLIAAAEAAKVGPAYAGGDPKRMQKILLIPAAPNTPQTPEKVIQARLMGMLTLHVHAYVILVNGRASIALPTPDDATQTLRLVKTHWAQMPPPSDLDGEPEIMERIAIEKRAVDTRLTRSDPATAAPYFWTPPVSRTYIVHRNDIGSRIAHRSHLSLSDLITSNPTVNINRLKPGTVLNVQKMPLLLTVRVRKRLVEIEKVHPNAPAAQAGSQRVTYLATYLNGQETRREAQSVDILEKPLTRMDL